MRENKNDRSDMARLIELYRIRTKDRKKAQTRRRIRAAADPKPINSLLGSLFRKDGLALYRIEQARALLAWERFVGEAAAQFSKPLRIRKFRLIVQVKNPLWRQQLLLLKRPILNKYLEHFPRLKLQDIFFVNE